MRVLFLAALVGSLGCRHTPAAADSGPHDGGSVGAGCPLDFAHCVAIEDHTTFISTTVGISNDGTSYGPPCIRIVAGAQVAILATPDHPLLDATCSPADSTLPRGQAATTAASYIFSMRGRYGYYSPGGGMPDGTGLAGLIIVE